MWHKLHRRCGGCRTTTRKYMARGLCSRCYLQQYQASHAERIATYKRRWREKHMERLLVEAKTHREMLHFDGMREKALKRAGYACEQCRSSEKLTVHHRDGNGRGSATPNNSLKNLQVLCRACHLAVHRDEIMRIRNASQRPQLLKCGRWSLKHDCCVKCGTTCSKHASKGVCMRCNVAQYRTR